jgi:phenylalanyl-tRNA synthetase alpha subunit
MPADAMEITATGMQQVMWAIYQSLRAHVEQAKLASVLGSNSELHHRWITA